MIGKLLGHSRMESTARYTHLARSAVHEAADILAKDILQDARRLDMRGFIREQSDRGSSRSGGDAPAVWHT